jgi:hypothetical protein
MALFDNYQKSCVTTAAKLFGDMATWISSDGAIIFEGLVFFSDPEKLASIGDAAIANYSPYDVHIEFFINQFEGLKLSVDSGNFEVLIIKEVQYYVQNVSPIKDGKTLIAILQPKLE